MPIRRSFAVLLLVFVTLGIYYPSIFAGANSVDDPQIITAFLNADHFDFKGIFLPGTYGYYYRPLLVLTLVFDNIVWGMHESFMHLDNVVFHVINVVLVFYVSVKVARRYGVEESFFPFSAAMLFAIHPINSESVNWISGRTDLLAANFILISILFLLNALQRRSLCCAAGAAIAVLLSCFAKEVAVFALPGLICIIVFYDEQGTLMERMRKTWVYSSLVSASVITYFLFRTLAFRHGDSGINSVSAVVNAPAFDPLSFIRITLKVYGFYLKKIFMPLPLNFAIVSISDYYVIAGLVFILIVIYILCNRSLISAFFLTSICIITPALLVAFGKMAWTPLAERYLYVPCATFSIALTFLVCQVLSNSPLNYRRPVYCVITLIFAASAYATITRNMLWQNNVELLQDTLRKSPNFFLAQNALAQALVEQGRQAEAKQVMLSMVAPEGNKRGGKLVDSNRARILMADGDLAGAKKLLLHNIEDSGVFYTNVAEQVISIDMKLLHKEHDKNKVLELRQEIVNFLLKLQEKNGDPLYFYRIGQFYLQSGDRMNAQRYFSEASLRSPEGAYYKLAAKKLAEKLKQ